MWQLRSLVVLHMCITRCSLGHGLFCAVHLYELHHEPRLLRHWGSTMIMLYDEIMLRLCYGYVMVMLWLLLPLLHQPGETCVMAPMSAKRELTCLQFLWFLESPSSLLAGAWSTPSSANSVDSINSETVGPLSRVSKTVHFAL